MLQVLLADAVRHPAAMMVHPQHAPAASTAVVGAGRLHALALLAVVHKLRTQVIDLVLTEDDRCRG